MGKHDKPRLSLPGQKPAEPEPIDHVVPVVALADTVIVKTAAQIAGQFEHAAIVTHVYDEDTIDVLLIPRGSDSYPVQRVSKSGSVSWRRRD